MVEALTPTRTMLLDAGFSEIENWRQGDNLFVLVDLGLAQASVDSRPERICHSEYPCFFKICLKAVVFL